MIKRTAAKNIQSPQVVFESILFALLAIFWSGTSQADSSLEAWRNEIVSARKLAENNAVLANEKARNLEAAIPADAKPSDKAKILNLLARTELYTAKTSAAANHAQQALNLAKLNSDRVGQAEAYLNISLNAVNQGRVDVIIDASPRAFEVLQGVDNPALVSEAMLRLAMMYLRIGQLDATVTLCMQAMDVAKRSNDPQALLYAHQGLGIAFSNNGRYAEAYEHYTQMRDLARAIKLKQSEGEAINGMATAQAKLGDWRTAALMHREAIALFRSVGVPFNIAHGLYALADNLRQHGLLADSLQILNEAVSIYEHYPNVIGLWWSLNARSENQQMLGALVPARADAERAYALAQNMGMLLYRAESAKRVAAIAAASGDHKRAYQLSSEAADLTEKMTREKAGARMVELAQRYQSESKQRKIDELTRNEAQRALEQRWLWTILGGSIILLAGTGFFLLRLRSSHRMLQASNMQLSQSQDEIRALNIGLEQRVQASTAELRQQTRYLRTLFETLPVSVWLKDTEGRYLTINSSHVAVNSLTAEQMLGKTDEELWPGAIGKTFRAADIEVMETRHRKTQELAIPGENGEIFWREIDKAPVIDDDGAVIGTVGVGIDIGERKRYEQSLLEKAKLEQRLSALAANIPGFAYTLRAEPDGHASFPFASAGVEKMFGLRPEEIRNDANILRARYQPDDLAHMLKLMEQSERTQTPLHAEIRIRNRDNEERWVEIRAIPQRQTDGSTEWHGIMLDITERMLSERKLKQSLELSEGIINAIPDILFEVDRNGKYLNIWTQNPELLAAQKEALLGKTAQEVLSPEAAAAAMEAIREADEKGVSVARDICIDLPHGRRWFAHSMAKKPGNTPSEATFMVLSRDITERKHMEGELAAREREFRAMADSSPGMMGSFYLRPDGSMCMPYASPNIYDLFGLHPQDIAEDASALLMLNHPDDAERVRETIAESARTMTVWHQEYRILHPTKGERWMESNTNPQPHPDGGTVWYGYVFDITERKFTERYEQFHTHALELLSGSDSLQNILEEIVLGVEQLAPGMICSILLLDSQGKHLVNGVAPHLPDFYNEAINGLEIGVGAGSCGTAAATGKLVITDDIGAHPYWSFYKGLAVRAGLGSCWSQPILSSSGRVLGTFATYHREAHSPAESDIALIQKTANLVSIAIERKLAEQELRQALEFNEGVINAIPDLLFEVDSDGRYLNVWTHKPELLAAQKEALLGNTVHDVLAPKSAAAIMEALREAGDKGASFGKVIHIDLPAGESWFELSVSKKLGSSPSNGTFLVLSRDITERKQMEIALNESEARYRDNYNLLQSIFESTSSVSMYALDREYRLLAFNSKFNEAAKRLWGADIAIGMSMLDVIDTDAHREFFRQGADQVLGGRSFALDSKEAVVKDGVTVYEYHENYGSPIRDDNGNVIGMTVFVITVTERKQLEAELRASRNFLDSVIDSVSDPIFVKDRQHRWTLLNDAFCAFVGKPREELLGKSDYDFFPKEQADVFWEKDELVFESGESNLNEESFTSADGEEHYIQTKKTPFVSGDGREMLVGIIRDITDLKHYEAAREAALAEAVRLAKSRSEFLAHMSHELRTPLNGILGYTQILQRNKGLGERNADALNVIRQSGEHLLALVEDILDLARIEAGRFKLDVGDIALATFLRVVTDIIRVRAKEKNIEFVCDFARDLPDGIKGDDKRLRQVLLNLLSNAVKFTEKGRVVLHVSRVTSSRLAFRVEDTGMGIPANELETIFQPFEQSGDTQQRFGGSGLGLSISRKLVRLMGGDITVESKQGEGSTFQFELELPEAQIAPAVLLSAPVDGGQTKTSTEDTVAEPLILPSAEELQTLHHLAQLGNMRDIIQYAERIANIDTCYQPFSEHLRRMAEGYQSKAILAFVEGHLHDTKK